MKKFCLQANGRGVVSFWLVFFSVVSIVLDSTAAPQCVPLPPGLVSWWRAEGNAQDQIRANNAVLLGGISFSAGEVGQTFSLNCTDANILVPASPSLNVGTGTGLTIEGWINPSDIPNQEWNSGALGARFWISVAAVYGGGGPGSLYANLIGGDGAYHQVASIGGLVLANVLQHVAVTYDRASGVATIYLNGNAVGQANLSSFTPQTSTDLY